MQHHDSPRKSLDGLKHRAAVLCAAVMLLAVFAAGVRICLNRENGTVNRLSLPETKRPSYHLHLRCSEDGKTLSVSEDIRWMNPENTRTERICLRVNAAAYAAESTSPAAVQDLYDTAYPDGFSAAELMLEGCWVNGSLTDAVFDKDRPFLLWIDKPLESGETAEITLHFRLQMPECASLFGTAGDIVRLVQALPAAAARTAKGWDEAPVSPYAEPQDMDLSDVRVTADLPEDRQLITGAETGTNEIAVLFAPKSLARTTARLDGLEVAALAETEQRANAILAAAKRIIPVYIRHYGQLPLNCMTLVDLPLTDTRAAAPGLVLVDSSLTGPDLEHRLAYWLAGQWFGWAVSADRYAESWILCAARQWAALRYIRDTAGAEAEADSRILRVEMPMRENLHAAVTPGTPADGFPDLSTFRTVMDGRAAAFLYALDTWMDGKLDSFLADFIREHAFARIGRSTLTSCINSAAGLDIGPLMLDWLDTYIQENP